MKRDKKRPTVWALTLSTAIAFSAFGFCGCQMKSLPTMSSWFSTTASSQLQSRPLPPTDWKESFAKAKSEEANPSEKVERLAEAPVPSLQDEIPDY